MVRKIVFAKTKIGLRHALAVCLDAFNTTQVIIDKKFIVWSGLIFSLAVSWTGLWFLL